MPSAILSLPILVLFISFCVEILPFVSSEGNKASFNHSHQQQQHKKASVVFGKSSHAKNITENPNEPEMWPRYRSTKLAKDEDNENLRRFDKRSLVSSSPESHHTFGRKLLDLGDDSMEYFPRTTHRFSDPTVLKEENLTHGGSSVAFIGQHDFVGKRFTKADASPSSSNKSLLDPSSFHTLSPSMPPSYVLSKSPSSPKPNEQLISPVSSHIPSLVPTKHSSEFPSFGHIYNLPSIQPTWGDSYNASHSPASIPINQLSNQPFGSQRTFKIRSSFKEFEKMSINSVEWCIEVSAIDTGAILIVRPCTSTSLQRWYWDLEGKIRLREFPSFCIVYEGVFLRMQSCNDAAPFVIDQNNNAIYTTKRNRGKFYVGVEKFKIFTRLRLYRDGSENSSWNTFHVDFEQETSVPSVERFPSLVPSSVLSASPSSVPSDVPTTCYEDPKWAFLLDIDEDIGDINLRTCRWLKRRKREEKMANICKRTLSSGGYRPAREVCLETCGTCDIRNPSQSPSYQSPLPSNQPSVVSSDFPSDMPSPLPSLPPSFQPSGRPTSRPSSIPTSLPSSLPSYNTSEMPSNAPFTTPSLVPSSVLSASPSSVPSDVPTTCYEDPKWAFLLNIDEDTGDINLRTCRWLKRRKREENIANICKRTLSSGGYRPAREVCLETCGTCGITIPSQEAPAFPSQMAQTRSWKKCPENSGNLFFHSNDKASVYQTCSWLENQSVTKIAFICDFRVSNNGFGPAREVCRHTCGTCDFMSPSQSPSDLLSYASDVNITLDDYAVVEDRDDDIALISRFLPWLAVIFGSLLVYKWGRRCT